MSNKKTNAMRILDDAKVNYEGLSYDRRDGKIDGISVANKIKRSLEEVFKTLVCRGLSSELYVFVIPVAKELDMKAAAKLVSEKRLDMLAVKDLQKETGYLRGACSPIGMKRQYRTVIDNSALELATMIVSGGRIGRQIELKPGDLQALLKAEFGKLS